MPTKPPKVSSPLAGRPCNRKNSNQRGYGYRWQRTARRYLANHPLCVACEAEGRTTAATDVDHIVPHRGDMRLFWDADNWQGLCKSCHSKKTNSGQ